MAKHKRKNPKPHRPAKRPRGAKPVPPPEPNDDPADDSSSSTALLSCFKADIQRWLERFAKGEPKFVQGDILDVRALAKRLVDRDGSMAALLMDEFVSSDLQECLVACSSGQCPPDEVELALVGFLNEIISGADLFEGLARRLGLMTVRSGETLRVEPNCGAFDEPMEGSQTRDFVEKALGEAAASLRQRLTTGDQQPAAETSLLDWIAGTLLSAQTKSELVRTQESANFVLRNRLLLNDSFPAEISPDLFRKVGAKAVVFHPTGEVCTVLDMEPSGENGVVLHCSMASRTILILMHQSQLRLDCVYFRSPEPPIKREIGFHTTRNQ